MAYSNHNASSAQDNIPSMGNNATTPYRPMNQARMDRGPSAQQPMEFNRTMDPSQQQTPSMEREPPPGYHMTTPALYDHSLIHTPKDSTSKKRPIPAIEAQGDNPRKRASVACNICRSRKSRCDGNRPKCKLCTELNAECIYQEPGVKLDAGDKMILERFDKLEAILAMMHGSELHELANLSTRYGPSSGAIGVAAMEQRVAPMQVPDGRTGSLRDSGSLSRLPLDQWPKLRGMDIGPYSASAMQDVESQRQLLPQDASLSLDFTNNDSLVAPFFNSINYAFPIIDEHVWPQIYESAKRVDYREGLDSCLVLLVLALGAASSKGPVAFLPPNTEVPGLPYFGSAFQLLSLTLTDRSAVAVQCTVLATLYYLYLVRPMEAYSLISTLPPKLQLLPRLPGDTVINRLIHSASLVASSFGHLGVTTDPSLVRLADAIQPPAPAGPPYSDHAATTWPFVAQITFNRVCQRISTETALADATQGPTAAALDQQLTEWWCTQVPVPDRPTADPPGRGRLSHPVLEYFRVQFFVARLQIYRPYLISVLTDESMALQPVSMDKDSCLSGLESAVCVLEDLPSTTDSAGVAFNPFANILTLADTALVVIASSMSLNLGHLLPAAKAVDGALDVASERVGRWAPTSPGIARAAEALKTAARGRAASLP